jgi:hypothetical protein
MIDRSLESQSINLVESPIKAVWSSVHKAIITIGHHVAYIMPIDTLKTSPFSTAEDHSFVDVDVSQDGYIALLLQSKSSSKGEVKILASNRFSIVKKIEVFDETLRYVKFTQEGDVVVISEVSNQETTSTSRVYLIGTTSGTTNEGLVNTTGRMVGLTSNENRDFIVAISSGGDVVQVPTLKAELSAIEASSDSLESATSDSSSQNIFRFEPKIIGNVGDGVSSLSFGPSTTTASPYNQGKIRVFVGSKPWTNDRWDSGEIETARTSILYGGGDNLKPGYSYWVHVSVWDIVSGWSHPQIRKFTLPNS